MTVLLKVQIYLGQQRWNGIFWLKSISSHWKLYIKAIKPTCFVKKTQCKFAKRVFFTIKKAEIWCFWHFLTMLAYLWIPYHHGRLSGPLKFYIAPKNMGLSILLANGGFRIPITKRFCQLLMMYVLLFLTLNRKLEFFYGFW